MRGYVWPPPPTDLNSAPESAKGGRVTASGHASNRERLLGATAKTAKTAKWRRLDRSTVRGDGVVPCRVLAVFVLLLKGVEDQVRDRTNRRRPCLSCTVLKFIR